MNPSPMPYRPAVRGLVFGLLALGLRAATMACLFCIASGEGPPGAKPAAALEVAIIALPMLSVVATLIALVGVGYAAIAAHRREWGPVLVLAFVASVAAVLIDVQPFLYASF